MPTGIVNVDFDKYELVETLITGTDGASISDIVASIYAGGIYVLVVQNIEVNSVFAFTAVLVSKDGVSWSSHIVSDTESYTDIAYGNGIFVLGGANSTLATSPDGITWTQQSFPIATNWSSVTYGNGIFVVLCNSTTLAVTSPDGINWTQRTLPVTAPWQSVIFGNGLFVAVAYNSTTAATSPDGINWTQRTLPTTANWEIMAHGKDTFIVIDPNTPAAILSKDGTNWVNVTLPALTGYTDLVFGNDKFLLLNYDYLNSAVFTSVDGEVWLPVPGITKYPRFCVFGEHKFTFLTFGYVGYDDPINNYFYQLVGSSPKYEAKEVVVDSNPNPSFGIKAYASLPASLSWNSVVYGNGIFVAAARFSSIAATSTDGITWTEQTLPLSGDFTSGIYANDMFILLDNTTSSSSYLYSSDGLNWTVGTFPATGMWRNITYGAGNLIAVNQENNTIVYSSDGIIWSTATLPVVGGWRDIAYGNGVFVAIVRNTTIGAVSTDGVNWTQTLLPINSTDDLMFGNGVFVITQSVGFNSAYSYDGTTWALNENIGDFNVFGNWGNNLFAYDRFFIAGFTSGDSLISTDGISWTRLLGDVGDWAGSDYGNDRIVFVSGGPSNKAGVYMMPTRTTSTKLTLVEPAKANPGNTVASVVVTGLSGVTAETSASAYIMGTDSSLSNNLLQHSLANIDCVVHDIVPGVGFTITATSKERLSGSFNIRYVWN